jgi:hypothetical protein
VDSDLSVVHNGVRAKRLQMPRLPVPDIEILQLSLTTRGAAAGFVSVSTAMPRWASLSRHSTALHRVAVLFKGLSDMLELSKSAKSRPYRMQSIAAVCIVVA